MEETYKNPLGTEKIQNLLVKFAIPSIISMLVSALYNIVDQFFIGRSVGMLGNAATNVAFPLTTTCVAISLLFGIGGASNFNLTLGRGDKKTASHYAGNSVFFLFFFGILLCIIVRIFLNPLLHLFGATSNVLEYSLIYTGITSLGFPFLILSNGGSNLVRADGSPRYSMLCMLTGAVINTILDPIFIFVFNMGIAGAAWATVIGQVISCGMIILYLTHFKTVDLKFSCFKPSFTLLIHIVSIGAAAFFNQIAMMLVQICMNNTLTYYGAQSVYGSDIPLACAGIIIKVGMIFFSFIIGLSQGLQPIISFNYGAKNYARVREAYLTATVIGTIISAVSFFIFQLFPRQIIGIFGSGSEEYFHFAEQYFRIYLFFTFINGLQPITSNFFTSIGKATKGIFLSLTRQIIFLLPLIVLLPYFMGIDGVMYAGPIADFAAAVLAFIFIKKELQKMKQLEIGELQTA